MPPGGTGHPCRSKASPTPCELGSTAHERLHGTSPERRWNIGAIIGTAPDVDAARRLGDEQAADPDYPWYRISPAQASMWRRRSRSRPNTTTRSATECRRRCQAPRIVQRGRARSTGRTTNATANTWRGTSPRCSTPGKVATWVKGSVWKGDRSTLTGSGRSLGGGRRGAALGRRCRRAVGGTPGAGTHPRRGQRAPPGRAGHGALPPTRYAAPGAPIRKHLARRLLRTTIPPAPLDP